MAFLVNLKSGMSIVGRSENTVRFLHEVKKYPVLSKEEEEELFDILHNGSPEERKRARENIILSNQRLVLSAAKKWATTDTLMDYVSEANIGLNDAVNSFDYTVGTKFASYAMWYIVRAINNYNNSSCQIVKKTNMSKTFHVISKATNEFIQRYERNPTPDELMELINTKYNKNIKDKNDLIPMYYASIDVDETSDDDGFNCSDLMEFNRESASYNKCVSSEKSEFEKSLTESILAQLSPRKREIIRMRFGINDDSGIGKEYEREEIAERLGLTYERVRQLENEAMAEMRGLYVKKLKHRK